MPSDFMLFEVSEQPDVEEDEEQSVTTSDANASKWDVNHRCVDEKDGVHERVFQAWVVLEREREKVFTQHATFYIKNAVYSSVYP